MPELRPQMVPVDYLRILGDAWEQHLAPRTQTAPTVISTFAGCGGSSLGYSMAGFRELMAVEWDDNAVATFKQNFPDVPVYHGDIAALSVEDALKRTGLQPGQLDILDGSPPCQGFSSAGKRDVSDDRNQLFREYVRLLRGLQPRAFVMENVSGMVKGKMKLIFAECLRELKASGYRVSARLMNAMYFNVPQARERLIFIGIREDLGIQPTHPPSESRGITPREAFRECSDEGAKPFPEWLRKAAAEITAGNYGGTDTARAFLKYKGSSASAMNFKLLSWGYPSCTITKSWISSSGIGHPMMMRAIATHVGRLILPTIKVRRG